MEAVLTQAPGLSRLAVRLLPEPLVGVAISGLTPTVEAALRVLGAELQVRAAILNRFTQLGTPETVRVA